MDRIIRLGAVVSRYLSPSLLTNEGIKPKGRTLQLKLDAATIYSIIQRDNDKSIHIPSSMNSPQPSEDEHPIAQHLGLTSLPSVSYQAKIIKYHLLHSVRHILHHTLNSLASTAQSDHLRKTFGFVPTIAESTIPTAGRGLFVDGTAESGSIIAIYPGVSYLPSQLRNAQFTKPHAVDETNNDSSSIQLGDQADDAIHTSLSLSDYAISRYDGVVIDGAQEISIDLDTVFDLWEDAPTSRPDALSHPFANAHIVNHPPESGHPNVLQFLLDIDVTALPPHLALLVPVRPSDDPLGRLDNLENIGTRHRVKELAYFISHAPNERLLRTVVLVSTRRIEDEEIFMDYRFNPAVHTPPWYHPCGDGQQGHRRWHSRSVLTFS